MVFPTSIWFIDHKIIRAAINKLNRLIFLIVFNDSTRKISKLTIIIYPFLTQTLSLGITYKCKLKSDS